MAASTPSKAILGTLCARTATPLATMRFTGTALRPINSLKKGKPSRILAGYITLYGRMRQHYLKEHRPGLYSSLILSEKLYPHLLEIDRTARERMDAMLPRMMEAAGVTEELKARDPMRWVGLMDTLKVQVEEIIQDELIYN